MAYAQGDIILRDHYNEFAVGNADGSVNHGVRNINTVWGTGNSDKGYGQTGTLSTVSAGTTVTATQWNTMITRLDSILRHQSGSPSGINGNAITAGTTIAYLSSLSGNITTAYNNRLNFNSTRGSATTTNYDGTWTSSTPTTFQQVRTVTFASGDAARYFFNAGGRIGLTLSISAGADNNQKEVAWSSLVNAIATVNFDQSTSGRTGSGQTLSVDGSGIGYYDLTTSDQTLIRLTATTSPYTANYIDVNVKSNGTQGANADKGSVITFTITYYDNADEQWNDDISMTMRAAITITPPNNTHLTTASWGTPTSAATTN